jgi:protein dithiol oxidoreductase (disulfide-forming)
MPTTHRACIRALFVLAAVLLINCAAAQALEEGKTFRKVVPPQPTDSPGKIEVVEFFSWGCPHCAHFYPLLHTWLGKQPKDVVFRRVPVGFNNDAWISLQRAFYALQASGDLDRLDGPLFHAIHEEHQQLFDEESLADWVGKNGGNPQSFSKFYTDLGVNSQTVRADEMAEKYQIDSVPTLAVNGEYVAMADSTPGETPYLNELLANTDKLIAKVRAERPAATKPPSKPVPKSQ